MKFSAILADCPWHFKNWGRDVGRRSAASHYKTMQIGDLISLPVAKVAADDCVLFLWVCWPFLFDGPNSLVNNVINGWGFSYKTLAFDWVKITSGWKIHFGMGYWTRANSEVCLLCTRGKPQRKSAGVSNLIFDEYEPSNLLARVGKHSEKPEAQYNRIESLVGGPYLELFATKPRRGWVSLGYDIDGRDVRDSIPDLIRKHDVKVPKQQTIPRRKKGK